MTKFWLSLASMLLICCSSFAQKPCGTERWPVKTLGDADGPSVAGHAPQAATVRELVAFEAPDRKTLLHAVSTRFAPQEESVYEVHALLIGFKKEIDRDFHIVIADPDDQKVTMVVEIPAGGCAAPGPFSGQTDGIFAALQEGFSRDFGAPASKFRRLAKPIPVDVRGVGFFDFIHGQTGVAKNGFELHPVIHIARE